MTIKSKHILVSAAVITFMLGAAAMADTTTVRKTVTTTPGAEAATTTTVTQHPSGSTTTVREETAAVPVPMGAHTFRYMDFDMNNDSMLSRTEIGDMLYRLYDRNSDNALNTTEYNQPAVITVTPAEKMTTVSYDFDGDGKADTVQYTYENFMERTMLSRFDKNQNGLSPNEFLGLNFIDADTNNNRVVDRSEWNEAYFKRMVADARGAM